MQLLAGARSTRIHTGSCDAVTSTTTAADRRLRAARLAALAARVRVAEQRCCAAAAAALRSVAAGDDDVDDPLVAPVPLSLARLPPTAADESDGDGSGTPDIELRVAARSPPKEQQQQQQQQQQRRPPRRPAGPALAMPPPPPSLSSQHRLPGPAYGVAPQRIDLPEPTAAAASEAAATAAAEARLSSSPLPPPRRRVRKEPEAKTRARQMWQLGGGGGGEEDGQRGASATAAAAAGDTGDARAPPAHARPTALRARPGRFASGGLVPTLVPVAARRANSVGGNGIGGSSSDDDDADGLPQRLQSPSARPARFPTPPVAPEDPEDLLAAMRSMPPPRRRLVVFKSGGYVMSDLEEMVASAGIGHVVRVTNLIRKAHCALAKARWSNGKRVDVRQHAAGAAKRGLPFLLVEGHRLELLGVVEMLRPVLIQKGIMRETRAEAEWRRGRQQQQQQQLRRLEGEEEDGANFEEDDDDGGGGDDDDDFDDHRKRTR